MNGLKIDWDRAPAVPTDILLKHARGEPIGGTIEESPLGQKVFVPDRVKAPANGAGRSIQSITPGGGIFADVGDFSG